MSRLSYRASAFLAVRKYRGLTGIALLSALVFSSVNAKAAEIGTEALRIERPSQLADTVVFNDITEGFKLWAKLYGRPGFCPILICNGSCKYFSDRCSFSSDDPVLSHFSETGGCGGGCRSAAQSDPKKDCCDKTELDY